VTDAATRLVSRLERQDNHLAIVLSVHLFVEQLLDGLIGEKSAIAGRILKDHRTYTFSVKLALVFHMRLLDAKAVSGCSPTSRPAGGRSGTTPPRASRFSCRSGTSHSAGCTRSRSSTESGRRSDT
jgi:hypothetical protein